MPSFVPTISTRPTGYWDRPHSQQSLPSGVPSIQPTSSINPSLEPSSPPSQFDQHSDPPSGAPSLPNPTSSPTEGLVVQGREFNYCFVDQVVLANATVTLFSVLGLQIDQTITDDEGRWKFTGLPQGRYYPIVERPPCRRVLEKQLGSLDPEEIDFSASLSDEQIIKFFKTGDVCNSKISLGDWDVFSDEDWNEVALFDTLDECCANMFWHDIKGCLNRSRVAFQFEFCVDISGLNGLSDCPLPEIRVIENAMRAGLDKNSNLTLTEIGSIVLTNTNDQTKCSRSEYSDEFLPSSTAQSLTTVCGTVTTKEACREEVCLKKAFKRVSDKFESSLENSEFSNKLRSLSRDASDSLSHLESVEVTMNSFVTKKLLLPRTVTSSQVVVNQNDTPFEHSSTSSDMPRFYPTFISGQLCHSKISFDSWEESYGTLKECCTTHFSWDYEACCKSEGMGEC